MALVVHLLTERCKGCSLCIEICQAEVLVLSGEKNKAGYRVPEVKKIEACLGCAMCEILCPEFAIWISREEKEILP